MAATNAEIARLREDVPEAGLPEFNRALEWLVRNYDLDQLYALVKDADPEWVQARGEVEKHLKELRLAYGALELYYGSWEKVRTVIHGMTEAEIIEAAGSLP